MPSSSRSWKRKGGNPPGRQPRALLRRIYLDLTGLPPTLEEQDAFLAHPDAAKLVDELLARPAYGERWGRHWLDLVRYAETNGYERDATKPHAWRYRDYVIRAFNDDKPFDRFVLEQLAGDELPERVRGDAHRHRLITAWAPGTTSRPTRRRTASTSWTTWSARRRRCSSA